MVQVLILFGVAGGAWLYQVELDLFPDARWAVRSRIADAKQSVERVFAPAPDPTASPLDVTAKWNEPGRVPHQSVPAAAVGRQEKGCAISQVVHNGSQQSLSPVVLEFSFEDALGHQVGAIAHATAAAVLPAGKSDRFTFQLPCPTTFASVKVRAPDEHIKVVDSNWPKGAAGTAAEAPPIDVHRPHLAIEVPSQAASCHSVKPCQLVVSFEGGKAAKVWFRRKLRASNILIADDPYLISELKQGRQAKLQLPMLQGNETLAITAQNLREPEPGRWGLFVRQVKKLIGIGEISS